MSDGLDPVPDGLFYENTIRDRYVGQRVFDRYTLQQMAGAGGMGQVWLALDEELKEDIALKFLTLQLQLDEVAMQELKRETRHSRKLAHTNIVKVYDFTSDSTAAAISMEYVKGETVSGLRAKKPGLHFEVGEIEPWIRQLLAALQYAHEDARIIHRDLKPSNVMVDENGKVKVTDFGISSSISESVSRVTMQPGSSGTLAYMSPQQLMGQVPKVTDDIYSLGATIYEMLTSKPPFYSGGNAGVLAQIREVIPPTMTLRRSDLNVSGAPIPHHWEEVVAACLAKEPEQRPQSVAEVARRLSAAPAMPPPPPPTVRFPPPPPPTLPGGPAPGSSSKSVVLIVCGVIAVIIIIGGLIAFLGWQNHSDEDRLHQMQIDAQVAQTKAAEAEKIAQQARDAQLKTQQEAEAAKEQADAAEKARAAQEAQAAAAKAEQDKELAEQNAKAAADKAQAEAQAQSQTGTQPSPPPAMAPSTETAPIVAPVQSNTQEERKKTLDQFFDAWWKHNASNVAADWAGDFAEESDYCYKRPGKASREFVERDHESLINAWPNRHYSLIKLNYDWIDSDNVRATANYNWDYTGAKGEKTGNCSLEMGLNWNGEKWEIVSYQEQDQHASPAQVVGATATASFERKNSLDLFFDRWWKHNASNLAADWAADFADPSYYCWANGGSGGYAPRSFVGQDRETLIQAWPARNYHLDKLDYNWIDSQTAQTIAVYDWDYVGARGEKKGKCRLDMTIQWNGVDWQITSYRENDKYR
jgi:serine/threonine protein kinase